MKIIIKRKGELKTDGSYEMPIIQVDGYEVGLISFGAYTNSNTKMVLTEPMK